MSIVVVTLKTPTASVKVLVSGLVLREDNRKNSASSSSATVALKLPDELPNVEETLKTLAASFEDSTSVRDVCFVSCEAVYALRLLTTCSVRRVIRHSRFQRTTFRS